MNRPFLMILIFIFTQPIMAQVERHELSIIRSIDDQDPPRNYIEVSEEALPEEYFEKMLDQMDTFKFTLLSANKVSDLFDDLTRNSRARMSTPGGKCSYRRSYIQSYLKKMNIVSGRLYIQCPGKRGRLRLRDQVTRRNYTYSNFHDTNIVAIRTNSGVDFRVMDLQFEDSPVTLQDYLSEIEDSQKIRPLKRKGSDSKGYCYWTVNTSSLTMK